MGVPSVLEFFVIISVILFFVGLVVLITRKKVSDTTDKEVGFWKHAFNWKLYIFPAIVGVLIAFHFSQTNEEVFSKVNGINTIIGIIAAVLFKSKIWNKIAMFIFTLLLSGIVMTITYLSSLYIIEKIEGDSGKREKIISRFLALNNTLPMMMNNQFQVIKYSSSDNQTFTMHGKFVNYTKNEILSDYSNNVSLFENDMLINELKTSCKVASTKEILLTGLSMNIEYTGKDNQIIGTININDEKCKPYY